MATETFDIGGDLTVNRMGAMRLCGPGIVGPPEDEVGEALDAVAAAGIELTDEELAEIG